MKTLSCFTCALLAAVTFSTDASARQLGVTFDAVVTFATASQPGALSAGVGSTIQVKVGLPSSGIPSGPDQSLYPVNQHVGGLRDELFSVPISSTVQPGLLAISDNDAMGLDRVTYQQFLSTGDNASIEINDLSQSLFSSLDLVAQVGTLPMPAGASAQVRVEAANGTPLITASIVSMTIAVDDSIGMAFCEALLNSTGLGGELQAFGSARISLDDFRLEATQLPPLAAGFVISSQVQNFVMPPGAFFARLCLGTPISRHLSTLGQSDAVGRFTAPISLAAFPTQPQTTGPVLSGQTWSFQVWHRDQPFVGPSTGPSNMTTGVAVTFE